MKMEQTECSETSACKIQTPGNYPEENIQHNKLLFRLYNGVFRKLCVVQSIHSYSLCVSVYFILCHLDYMFRPLYNLGHHQVPRLFVLLTCKANYLLCLVFHFVTTFISVVLFLTFFVTICILIKILSLSFAYVLLF
jgi:hypothetical protein